MATVQERLKQSRTPLDKWSTREQLCLASAVSCSGDQNWMSVSRTMKLVCGMGVSSVPRPADWYSQKSCAVQYGNLLENVETPKRKKRTSESSNSDTSTSVETPTDLVLRKLTEERMQELKKEISKNQDEYAKLYKDIKELQSGNCSEERLIAMWQDMEEEEEAKRLQNIKLEEELREREQRKQEMQRNWRVVTPTVTVSNVKTETTATEGKQETTPKTKPSVLQIQSDVTITQQPQTSPLLSSLLKSPTSSNTPTNNNMHVTSVARATAPTITTLLTGGTIPIKQPVVIINNTDVGQMLTRPASGPPSEAANATQALISPSQSAPTLSLLLEKTKANNGQNSNAATATASTDELHAVKVKQEQIDEGNKETVRTETNNEDIQMELGDSLPQNTSETNNIDVDETDPNEEQQLLEVFKNIGNIEFEIDTEFLTAMEEEHHGDNTDIAENFENKLDNTVLPSTENIEENEKVHAETITTVEDTLGNEKSSIIKKEDEKNIATPVMDAKEIVNPNDTEKIDKPEIVKVETSSSDDSSDDVPLSNVASVLESKELKEKSVDEKQQEDTIQTEVAKEEMSVVEEQEKFLEIKEDIINKAENEENYNLEDKKEENVENKNVQVEIAEIEEVKQNATKIIQETDITMKKENVNITKNAETVKEEIKMTKTEVPVSEVTDETTTTNTEVIPITDTDTDSSCTPEVEKNMNLEQKAPVKIERMKPERLVSEDSDSIPLPITPTLPPSVTPARPPALRKLRERDRSESPMIEDDTEHNNSTTSRLRRRASSTPLIDSIPNSPASVSDREDRELRTASKKSLLNIFNGLQQKHGKHITLLEKSFCESSTSNGAKYEEVCLRPMDFQVIQQNIENGSIRSTLEMQRDILLMCQNAIMLYAQDTEQHCAAMQIKHDCRNLTDLCQFDKNDKDAKDKDLKLNSSNSTNATGSNTSITPTVSGIKSRSGFRKSQRIT